MDKMNHIFRLLKDHRKGDPDQRALIVQRTKREFVEKQLTYARKHKRRSALGRGMSIASQHVTLLCRLASLDEVVVDRGFDLSSRRPGGETF
jgi:hypothetical protein